MKSICTTKRVAQSGSSVSVNISKECKRLGIEKGDWITLRIEPVEYDMHVCSCEGCMDAPFAMVSFDGVSERPMCRSCVIDRMYEIHSFRKLDVQI